MTASAADDDAPTAAAQEQRASFEGDWDGLCVCAGVCLSAHSEEPWSLASPRLFPPVVSLYSPCLLPVMRDPALQRVNEEQRHLGGARIDSISFPCGLRRTALHHTSLLSPKRSYISTNRAIPFQSSYGRLAQVDNFAAVASNVGLF